MRCRWVQADQEVRVNPAYEALNVKRFAVQVQRTSDAERLGAASGLFPCPRAVDDSLPMAELEQALWARPSWSWMPPPW